MYSTLVLISLFLTTAYCFIFLHFPIISVFFLVYPLITSDHDCLSSYFPHFLNLLHVADSAQIHSEISLTEVNCIYILINVLKVVTFSF